jgi:hypothetical protein
MTNGNRETFALDRADVRAIKADEILVLKVWNNPER